MIFGWCAVALLAFLTILEWLRFRAAAAPGAELPYPRRRFSRRVAIAVIFSAAVLGVLYFPEHLSPLARLGVLVAILVGAIVGLLLVWRDLRETSRAILEVNARFQSDASRAMEKMMREQDAASENRTRSREKQR